jgi:hypothetical protein
MFYAAIAPQAALRSSFGEALEGPLASVATASKLVFIALVLTYGRSFLGHQAGVSVAVDAVMVVLWGAYLLRREGAAT